MAPNTPKQSGFSLIELLVVLAIIAAALAIMSPRIGGGETVDLQTTAQRVVAGLKRTRDYAMTTNQAAVMSFDVETGEISAGDGTNLPPVPHAIKVSLFTARSEQLDTQSGGIKFFPDGSSTGGRITLDNHTWVYEVDVDWLTGRTKVHERSVGE